MHLTADDRRDLLVRLAKRRGASVANAKGAVSDVAQWIARRASAGASVPSAASSIDFFDRVLFEAHKLAIHEELGPSPHTGNVARGERRRALMNLSKRLETIAKRGQLPKQPLTISCGCISDLRLRGFGAEFDGALPSRLEVEQNPRQEVFHLKIAAVADAAGLSSAIRASIRDLDLTFYGADSGGGDLNSLKRATLVSTQGILEEIGIKVSSTPGGPWDELTRELWALLAFKESKPDDFENFDRQMRMLLLVRDGGELPIPARRRRIDP